MGDGKTRRPRRQRNRCSIFEMEGLSGLTGGGGEITGGGGAWFYRKVSLNDSVCDDGGREGCRDRRQ